jgi:tRNA-specific 2-thiouridylase
MREGEVVDPEGAVLAAHHGAAAFTVGQRRRLGVSAPEPRYVLEVDVGANRIVVGPGELLARRGLIADRVQWVAGGPPDEGPFEATVRLRSRGVVVFRGDEVLGGARILESIR